MNLIFGIIGLLVISIAIWIKEEKTQDYFFIVGGLALLVYSISISEWIFIILQIIFIISALVELIKKSKK